MQEDVRPPSSGPSGPERLPARYEDLSPLGKAVALTGGVAKVAATALEAFLARAADVVAHSERAFREGRDGTMDDARVLRETRRRDLPSGRSPGPPHTAP